MRTRKLNSKESFNTEYLTRFPLKGRSKVTAIVPTYNRSPYKNIRRNPLFWHLKGLLRQRFKPSQIVVVNDGSQDYTTRVISHFRNISDIDIDYLRNRTTKGLPKSLHLGIRAAENEFLYYSDDDCISAPHALWGAEFCIEMMKEKNPKTAVIVLPVYKRSTLPTKVTSKSNIGKIDLNNGEITSNFDAMPTEYISHPKYLDKKRKILFPLKVRNLCFHQLARKSILLDVGIPTEFNIKNFYGEWTELGMRIHEAGYDSYFLPDPKFHAFHAKYGYPYPKSLSGFDWWKHEMIDGLSFKKIVKESSKPKLKTGCRVDDVEWYKSKIRGFLRVLYSRNMRAGKKWCKSTYLQFVIKNTSEFRGTTKRIAKRKLRLQIWEKAISAELGKKTSKTIKNTLALARI